MTPIQSPFKCGWCMTSLDNVGLGKVRPRVGTYGDYDYQQLPKLPFQLQGKYEWLSNAIVQSENSICVEPEANSVALRELEAFCRKNTIKLPSEFLLFMSSPSLQSRIRSNTDCYLDLASKAVRLPDRDGFMIRFLADSQGCV